MDKQAWMKELFQSIDSMDVEKFVSFLTDDAQFVLGNNPPMKGKAAIKEGVGGFFSSIGGISHRILDTWEHPDAIICRGEVTYTRKDGSKLTVPFANIFKMGGELIKDYLVYVDASALYATSS